MENYPDVDELRHTIRKIYRSDPAGARLEIESYLETHLSGLAEADRCEVLEALASAFKEEVEPHRQAAVFSGEVYTDFFSRILGKTVRPEEIDSGEALERAARSINTIFDTLNRLIHVMNMTFLGTTSGDKTIRYYIGHNLEGGGSLKTLEGHLGQIEKNFLMLHESFRESATQIMADVLGELDPDVIEESTEGSFSFGPLKRAEKYRIFETRYRRIRDWFDSGRFTETLLREFEKRCERQSMPSKEVEE